MTSQVEFFPTLSCLKNDRTGQCVYLTPSEKKLFEIVLDGQGSKENIIHEIWVKNGTVVGESSYHQLIKNLRRKLKLAGLSCSMIKTIPRYGVVFVNYDQGSIAESNSSDDERRVGDASEELTVYIEEAELAKCDNELILPDDENEEKKSPHSVKPDDEVKIKKVPYKLAFIVFVLALLWPLVFLVHKSSLTTFPFDITVENVKFHFLTSEQMSQKNFNEIKRNVPSGVKDVYIASNGPKVWIAKCNKEISQKDSQCQYEYFSIY
ncbi:winged helix-turn-helix domain-containing protein [Izhakiella australiensis]|uniref:winged helix-turn-helix domain-containing protein n=1 Tax=Izhakiella australiensis TaxID=1926881 RepID=UPI001590A9E2|nr:helix-turn-helix domain-containing protein [Izhakiella australiensis]